MSDDIAAAVAEGLRLREAASPGPWEAAADWTRSASRLAELNPGLVLTPVVSPSGDVGVSNGFGVGYGLTPENARLAALGPVAPLLAEALDDLRGTIVDGANPMHLDAALDSAIVALRAYAEALRGAP